MNYILLDPPPERFYPFTLTRPLAEMRVFGGTIKEMWEQKLGVKVSHLTRPELSDLYPTKWDEENLIIRSDWKELDVPLSNTCTSSLSPKGKITWSEAWEFYTKTFDYSDSCEFLYIDLDNYLYSNLVDLKIKPNIKKLDCSKNPFLNDDDGPILVEKGVVIMEGAMIRGPVHICEGSIIKMGAKIYGPTVIGPYCKIGGEVSNSIFLGYSNKAHDGFLGHSIIGEWCNIGAGTSNSNLKNNYDTVKIWDYASKKFKDSEKQFLGLYMGDHSKCAINTSFNTGTTVGVSCNIFGSGFPRNYIPSFSWGGPSGYKDYDIEKAITTAQIVMKRRGIEMSSEYEKMLKGLFSMTASFRS